MNPNNELAINEYYFNPHHITHSSNVVGSYIVNAVTNEKYPFMVGSEKEKLLFKVKNTTKNANFFSTRENDTLYFDDPEQYMNFRDVILDPSVVERWQKRNAEILENDD